MSIVSCISLTDRFSSISIPISFSSLSDKMGKIALGIATGVMTVPVANILENRIVGVLTKFNFDLSAPQDVLRIFTYLSSIRTRFLSVALKVVFIAYAVTLGPLLEERIFRHILYNDKVSNAFFRIMKNAVFFGLLHASPFQGWTNVPIVLVAGFGGAVFATLREVTGDITASSAAHMTYNSIAMSVFLQTMAK